MAELRIYAGVCRIAVIGVDEMTGATAAGAIVRRDDRWWPGSDMTGSSKRVFWRPRKNRVGAQPGAQTAVTELVVRLARVFFTIGIGRSRLFFRPPRSNTRRTLPGWDVSQRKRGSSSGITPLVADFFGCGPGKSFDRLRFAATIVAFHRSARFSRDSCRCCIALRPRAFRRGSSCWWRRRGSRRRGSLKYRKSRARREDRRD